MVPCAAEIPQEDTADCGLRKSFAEPKQLKWSQLRVGITVIVASLVLGAASVPDVRNRRLLHQANHAGLLLRQCGGAAGGRSGAAQRRGYRQRVEDSHRPRQRQAAHSRGSGHEGEHEVQLQPAPRYPSLLSRPPACWAKPSWISTARRPSARRRRDGDTLPTQVHPDFNEVVRSSQSTLQNMDALLKRADRILAFAESGKGSLGKLIYDPTLYDRFSQTVAELKTVVDEIAKGQGSLGQLINNNDAYDKFVATLDKMNARGRRPATGQRHRRKIPERSHALQQCQRHHRQLEEGERGPAMRARERREGCSRTRNWQRRSTPR